MGADKRCSMSMIHHAVVHVDRERDAVETRFFSAFLVLFVTRLLDSRPLWTRLVPYCSPSCFPYFKTPSSIFPGVPTLLYASQSPSFPFQPDLITPIITDCSGSLSCALARFLPVLSRAPCSFTRLTCSPAPADREASSLVLFPHSLILCAAGV